MTEYFVEFEGFFDCYKEVLNNFQESLGKDIF